MPASAVVPPFIAPRQLLILLLQIGLLLLAAIVLGRLAARFNLPALVGELGAGVLLGPSVLPHLLPALSHWLIPADPVQFHLLDAVGQIGVLLLVALVAAQLDPGLVRARNAAVARISGFGLAVPFALGAAVAVAIPLSVAGTGKRTLLVLFLGVAMSVSAVPVIAKTLTDMGLVHREVAQLILAAGVIDDVFAWLMLSLLSSMATTGVTAGTLLHAVGGMLGLLLAAYVIGRPVISRFFAWAARSGEPGPPTAAAVVCVMLTAAATAALGLEPIFGAFVCGVLIRRYGRLAPDALAALRTVALSVPAPIFFATVGLRMDLSSLADGTTAAVAALVLAAAIAGKFAGAYLGARSSRMTGWEGLALGAGMNARGVVEVVVAMVGLRLGILSDRLYTIVILLAVVTSLLAPPVLRLAMARIDDARGEGAAQQLVPRREPVAQAEL